jgi:hypothetical protein
MVWEIRWGMMEVANMYLWRTQMFQLTAQQCSSFRRRIGTGLVAHLGPPVRRSNALAAPGALLRARGA